MHSEATYTKILRMLTEQIETVADDIKKAMGDNLAALYNYGSALTEYYCDFSDLDFLVILKEATPEDLAALRRIVIQHATEGTSIDINVQTEDEMPSKRNKAFWHNNRAAYMQREISLYGKLLHGDDQFAGHLDLDQKELTLECVRVLNSLVYQTRKALINRELTTKEKYTILKFCIYGAMYALAAKDIFPQTSDQIFEQFKSEYEGVGDPEVFSKLKTTGGDVDESYIIEAYRFLKRLDEAVHNVYLKEL